MVVLKMLKQIIECGAVPDGEGRAVDVEGVEKIAVFHSEGQFFVTQDVCSHAKASLADGWLEGFEIQCPVHDGKFDLRDGKPLCFPVTEPIRVFPCEIRDGQVWADLSGARKLAN